MQLCHSLLLIAPCCLKNVSTLWPRKSLQMLPAPHVWSGPLPFPSMPECSCHLHVMAPCLLYLCSFCSRPLEYLSTPLHLRKFYPSFKTQLPYHFLCKLPPYLSSFRTVTPSSESPEHWDILSQRILHSRLSSLLDWTLHIYIHYHLHRTWCEQLGQGKEEEHSGRVWWSSVWWTTVMVHMTTSLLAYQATVPMTQILEKSVTARDGTWHQIRHVKSTSDL